MEAPTFWTKRINNEKGYKKHVNVLAEEEKGEEDGMEFNLRIWRDSASGVW